MADEFTPGQTIRCTVTAQPRTDAGEKTIARLMRQDSDISKGLRRAQQHRRRTMNVHTRGGRPWYARARTGKNLRVAQGESWTMVYIPQLAADLHSVRDCLSIEAA